MKYRVNVLGVQGANNQVFKANEILTETDFTEDQIPLYLKEGKLVEITEVKKKEKELKKEADV